MNSFGKTFLAALLAFIVASALPFILFSIVVAGIASLTSGETVAVKPNTVLAIDLSDKIVDVPVPIDINDALMKSDITPGISLLSVVNAIDAAATDDNIKGIYINPVMGGAMSLSSLEELRAALLRFKESGKFIVSYAEYYSQGAYYIASVADRMFMHPAGELSWQGMAMPVYFYKGLFDKLDVKPEVLRHGTFKSAVEPYVNDRMSDANRLQMNKLAGSIWNGVMLAEISASRGVTTEYLNRCASELLIDSPDAAVERGMVDGLLYKDRMMSLLGELVENGPEVIAPQGAPEDPSEAEDMGLAADSTEIEEVVYDTPRMVSLADYASSVAARSARISKNKVAIIYASGEIVDGDTDKSGVVCDVAMGRKLAEARDDKNVKAVVLRVDSPGGSALASELIWREIELLKAEKPVVVSMGQYAASGGYYISCPADIIVADRTTITGSIGVFGLMFDLGKTLKNKVGITVDVAKTNPSADMGAMYRPLSSGEREYLMKSIERVYSTFTERVADGRNLTVERVDEIGQGRVWTGIDAKEIGLIDGFGGLADAIALAADRGEVADDYRVVEIADEENPFAKIMKMLSKSVRAPRMEDKLGELFMQYRRIDDLIKQGNSIQALMPYMIDMRQ